MTYERPKDYFCENQFIPTDRPGQTHCSGHLAEGYVPPCNYELKHIQFDSNGKLYISMIKGSTGLGCCQDFGPANPEGLVKIVRENSSLLKRCLRALKGK